MKKPRGLLIFVGSFAAVILVTAAAFLIGKPQGRLTTSEPIQVNSVNLRSSVSSVVQNLNPVVIKTVLVINGKKNSLLATFQDKEKAMQSVKKRDTEFLQLMKKKWKLDDLNASNWKTYQQHLVQYNGGKLPDDLDGEKYRNQYWEVTGFFEIYEDDERNQETIKYINFVNFLLSTRFIRQVSLDPIVGNLPFDAPAVNQPS